MSRRKSKSRQGAHRSQVWWNTARQDVYRTSAVTVRNAYTDDEPVTRPMTPAEAQQAQQARKQDGTAKSSAAAQRRSKGVTG